MKTRLDSLLVERGLYESRARAARAVLAGEVRLGGGRRTGKPGERVAADVELEVERGPEYASRGGLKLRNGLEALGISPEGRRCLDVGASTGGFTDCLLRGGAEHVVALDVAYGALDWRLRSDPRVTVVERTNARALRPEALPYAPDLIVVDVSFISLAKVLPAVVRSAAARFELLALVKPQFELGRDRVGRGGVVRSAADRRAALTGVGAALLDLGCSVLGYASSGLPGPAGNRESFVWASRVDHPGALADLDAAARLVEP